MDLIIVLQLNPGNSNCHGKLELLRVIGVSSCRVFKEKTRNTLLKKLNLCLYMFNCKISSNERAWKRNKTKENKT